MQFKDQLEAINDRFLAKNLCDAAVKGLEQLVGLVDAALDEEDADGVLVPVGGVLRRDSNALKFQVQK